MPQDLSGFVAAVRRLGGRRGQLAPPDHVGVGGVCIASEMKEYAKRELGSVYEIDRGT